MPFEKEEEAAVEVTLSRLVWMPPVKVEVAVEVALKRLEVVVPYTESGSIGEVVPMPNLPALVTTARFVLALFCHCWRSPVCADAPTTEITGFAAVPPNTIREGSLVTRLVTAGKDACRIPRISTPQYDT